MSVPDSPAPARSGCTRHLLVIVGLLALALGVFVFRNPEGVQRLIANQSAMREGRDEARALKTPEDLLAWIAAHPEKASLVVLEGDTARIAYQPDQRRPVAGLPALWLVAEWAAQSDARTLGTTRIAPETLNVRRLPGTGGLPDTAAVDVTTLVARTAQGDRVAESALLDVLGLEAVATRAQRYGAAPPIPFEGLLLAWQRGGTHATDAPALARRLATDAAFRAQAVADFHTRGFALSLDAQRRAGARDLPHGSASAYARLLADALAGELESPAVSNRFLEPFALPNTTFGSKSGGFPGHLSLALWLQGADDAPPRVAVLLLADLPLAVFYHLVQTRLPEGLALRLLTDDGFQAEAARSL